MVRFKNRWLLVEFIPCESKGISPAPLTSKAIWNALKESVVTNFGVTGWGAVGGSLNVKYFSPTTNVCLIRVARDHHRLAWGSVSLISTLEGSQYIPYLIHLSGTIKKAQLAAIEHDRTVVARLRARSKEPNRSGEDEYTQYLKTSQMEIEALQD